MTSYFSKILKKFEVGQLHGLVGCMTEQTRENAKYMIPTKSPFNKKRSCPTSKKNKNSLLLYDVYTSPSLLFLYIVLIKQKLIFCFEILAIFLTFALQKIFW